MEGVPKRAAVTAARCQTDSGSLWSLVDRRLALANGSRSLALSPSWRTRLGSFRVELEDDCEAQGGDGRTCRAYTSPRTQPYDLRWVDGECLKATFFTAANPRRRQFNVSGAFPQAKTDPKSFRSEPDGVSCSPIVDIHKMLGCLRDGEDLLHVTALCWSRLFYKRHKRTYGPWIAVEQAVKLAHEVSHTRSAVFFQRRLRG